MKLEKLWNNIKREKLKHLERKISQFHFFFTTNVTWTGTG